MWPLLGLIVFFLVINAGLLAAGIGVGYLLRWLLPGVELGSGILIGVVTVATSAYLFARALSARITEPLPEDETQEEEELDDDSPVVIYAPPFPGRRRKKRRRR